MMPSATQPLVTGNRMLGDITRVKARVFDPPRDFGDTIEPQELVAAFDTVCWELKRILHSGIASP